MSHVLATAAEVIGGVALVVATAGVAAPALAAAAAGAIGTTVSTISTVLAIAGAVAGIGAELLAPKPPVSPMAWSANPQAPMTYAMGRCYVGGDIVGRWVYGDNDVYQQLVTSYSGAGPHQSFDQLYVDGVAKSTAGDGTVNIKDYGFMWAKTQLGETPEASYLTVGPGVSSEWTPDCKLSGHAASIIVLKYDTKGGATLTTTPQVGFVGHWAKCYDPRKDSTYPGGSGAHRSDDETTWEWTANPFLHAITWLIGRRQDGILVLGVGMPVSGIIMDQFVEGANIADANGWTLGGTVKSSDDKWDVLKQILQTGSAQPMRLGAQVGCIVNTPRVSLATIEIGDIVGDWSVQATQARRDRFNAVVPRYVAETSVTTLDSKENPITEVNWEMAPAAPIVVADYVTADGKKRQKGIDYPLVTGPTNADGTAPQQIAQLARYDIENAREFGPITLPLKLRWMGYKPGDVVTGGDSLGELGLVGQDILLLNRALSPANGTVTMTARSETSAKHAYALGQTTMAPPTPSVAAEPAYINPLAALYASQISTMIRDSYVKCATSPLVAADAGDSTGTITIADTIWDYPGATAEVSRTGGTLTGLDLGTRYYVYFDDQTLLDTAPTYFATTDLVTASNGTATPYRHNLGSVDVPAAGGGSTPGGGDAGGGSACPAPAMYLAAKGRGKVRADALTTADFVWGCHEITGVWDWYQISSIGPVTGPMYQATIGGQVYETTGSHLWRMPGDRAWRQMAGLSGAKPIGDGSAIAIEVTDAHTYLLFASADDPVGVLSHNKLMNATD